jgi:uncharacterized membrane protein YkoI
MQPEQPTNVPAITSYRAPAAQRALLPLAIAAAALTGGGWLALAQDPPPAGQRDQERRLTEADVPAAALAALRKLAGDARLEEISEEVEDGRKTYEAEWETAAGEMEAEVTEAGDVLEVEQEMQLEAAPAAVREAASREAGTARASCEKITLHMYEIEFRKDGREHEILFTADGRRFREEVEPQDEKEGADD